MSEITFRKIYHDVGQGNLVEPRGMKVIEVEDYSYDLPPYSRFANFESRKLKLDYVKQEVLWYLRANPFDTSITEFAVIWKDIINADNSINSNYGAHVFGSDKLDYYNNVNSQCIGGRLNSKSLFDRVIEELVNDKDSRRASMTILNRHHLLNENNKDVPCTYAINFRIRNNELKMSVHMRSQDAIFGMGNDAPAFSIIQEMVYVTLRDLAYPSLKMGNYHHTSDSFHVYERHFKMLKEINNNNPYVEITLPKIRDINEVKHLQLLIHSQYPLGENLNNYNTLVSKVKEFEVLSNTLSYQTIQPANGNFSNWLLSK